VVARGVFAEIAAGRGSFLDVRKIEKFAERYPTVFAACAEAGIDPARAPIPVAPAAHYHMGGVLTDANARTSVDGLWAAGEVAATGAHGANRLASNSLLEAVVFAARAAADIGGQVPVPRTHSWPPAPSPAQRAIRPPAAEEERLRKLMSAEAGVIRTGAWLARALEQLAAIEREAKSAAVRDMAIAAFLIAAAAYARTESRGAHFRADFPESDPRQAHRSFFTLEQARAVASRASARAA
jgi:L-aspartate oxidase